MTPTPPPDDPKAAAWMLRYGARSFAHNLSFIPEERAGWKPHPQANSPLEVAAEAIRALHMYRPILDQPEFPERPSPAPVPETLAEARELLVAVADEYAAALERTGPELDRPQAMPFGGVFRATRAACYPLLDLFHHHGQVCYLQTLLGDGETHWCEEAIAAEFEWRVADPAGG